MGHYTLSDLNSQQKSLTEQDYDLRITNIARFIYRKMPTKRASLIDIGAGNGLVLRFFRNKGLQVTGMELSKELCDVMKRNSLMKGIEVVQGDIQKVRGKEKYNYVLASDVIEHIKDDKQALSNLFSFVKPGGLLIVSVPAHQFLYGKRDTAWGHFRRYSKKDLRSKIAVLKGKKEFLTYWNLVGFFAYFFYEKILGKPIREDFRYKSSVSSRIVRVILDLFLRAEELFGFSPIGLTLIVGVRK